MKSLTRNISYWLLLVLSLASAGVGGWIISNQSTTMTTALLDGTATGVEVYVGQPLIVVGAALVGAGIIGILLALALSAVKALLPAPAPVVVEPIDWTADASADDATNDLRIDASNDSKIDAEATSAADSENAASSAAPTR